MRRSLLIAFLLGALALTVSHNASAQGFSINVQFDENGNGNLANTAGFSATLSSGQLSDPGPGGQPTALTYSILNPPGLTAGDLILLEPGAPLGTVSDIVRFNPNQVCFGSTGCVVVYSDNSGGIDSIADQAGLPTALQTNTLTLFEVASAGHDGIVYTPTAGQPGFVAGAAGPVTYTFLSDTSVPEPASLALLGFGFAWTGIRRLRRTNASA